MSTDPRRLEAAVNEGLQPQKWPRPVRRVRRPAYCALCGKKEVPEATGMFNTRNGKPEVRYVCPDSCAHGGHAIAYRTTPTPNWLRWLIYEPTQTAYCPRCGIDL